MRFNRQSSQDAACSECKVLYIMFFWFPHLSNDAKKFDFVKEYLYKQ